MEKLKKVVDKEIAYQVSNIDIMRAFQKSGYKITIKIYSQLENVNNLIQLLPKTKSACFILLQTSDKSGHWIVIIRNNKTITYWDSYGIKADGELSNIPQDERYELDEENPLLQPLISSLSSDYNYIYNSIKFQDYGSVRGSPVNTCGRWCITVTKMILLGMSLLEFQNNLKNIKKSTKLTFDQIISLISDQWI